MKKLVIDDYEICLKIIAGNGHFRDTNFQKLLGEHAPRPPRQLAPLALLVPSPLKVLDLLLFC